MLAQRHIIILVILLGFCGSIFAAEPNSYHAEFDGQVKGIYISQDSLEDRQYLEYLIHRSKSAGINTFIIDLHRMSNNYERNILLVKNAGIKFIARIMVFPHDPEYAQMRSEVYLMTRYRLVESAIALGAKEIHLDYIHNASNSQPLAENEYDSDSIVNWFQDKIDSRAKLQIDVFNETNTKDSRQIAQSVVAISDVQSNAWYAWSANNKYDNLFNMLGQ